MPDTPQFDRALVWFRRDLRFMDHAALYHALTRARRVWCVFVFDTDILGGLSPRSGRRVSFLHHCVAELGALLREHGGGLIVRHGRACEEIAALAVALQVQAVYANRDYEPAANARDEQVGARLRALNMQFQTFKDQVIFERDEIMTAAGTPYSVFTPYKNAWLKRLDAFPPNAYAVSGQAAALARPPPNLSQTLPAMAALGFGSAEPPSVAPGLSAAEKLFRAFLRRIDGYDRARDFPALKGPSYLSSHLRFGTVSIRHLVAEAHALAHPGARTWLSELIWRDFYFQVLHHHPRVVTHAFRRDFEGVAFDNDPQRWSAWCEGRTGYPLVDAAMRQIEQTGYMHNRLRMVTASFLVKDLHIDWRRGEKYFADLLTDYDLSANNGGWQWAASIGCEAQPYFRIFNPVTQSEKFDPDGKFIRRYLPELSKVPARHIHAPWRMTPSEQQAAACIIGSDYPMPVVDHDQARRITLERYAEAKRLSSKHGHDGEP